MLPYGFETLFAPSYNMGHRNMYRQKQQPTRMSNGYFYPTSEYKGGRGGPTVYRDPYTGELYYYEEPEQDNQWRRTQQPRQQVRQSPQQYPRGFINRPVLDDSDDDECPPVPKPRPPLVNNRGTQATEDKEDNKTATPPSSVQEHNKRSHHRHHNNNKHRHHRSNSREKQEQLEAQRKLEQEKREQEEKRVLELNNKASKIQRWVRMNQERQRRLAAAKIIESFMTNAMEELENRKAQPELAKLRKIYKDADDLRREYRTKCLSGTIVDDRGRVRMDILAYDDKLLKLLLAIDSTQTYGLSYVRSFRKTTVRYIQSLLRELDDFRAGRLDIEEALTHDYPMDLEQVTSSESDDSTSQMEEDDQTNNDMEE